MLFRYYLEINKDKEIVGTSKFRGPGDPPKEVLFPNTPGNKLVEVPVREFYRFDDAGNYLPTKSLTAIKFTNHPVATWNEKKKLVEFYPLLMLKSTGKATLMERGEFISTVLGDVSSVYKTKKDKIELTYEAVDLVTHTPLDSDTVKYQDMHRRVLAGAGVLTESPWSVAVDEHDYPKIVISAEALDLENPLMVLQLKHPKLIISDPVFYFVYAS